MRPINRSMLKLALPSILANITVPIVGMVDIAVAGHLEGGSGAASLIGGISIGSMLFDLLYWNFGFLRAGTGGLTAQAYGRGNARECADNLSRGVGLSLAIAVCILLIQWPFAHLVMSFMSCTEQVHSLALQYFFIRIWAAPATLSLMAMRGWFIGMQDTLSSMFTDLVVNGVNIAASIILSYGLHWGPIDYDGIGFPGIALGTVAAQYSGLLFAWMVVAFKYGRKYFSGYGIRAIRASFKKGTLGEFASVNTDLFVRSVCLVVIYIGFTAISVRYGDVLLACCSIMMQLLLTFSYFTDGFAFAGEALTGKAIGMGDKPMTREVVRWTFIWSMAIGGAFVFIYAALGVPMMRLMTESPDVLASCRQFMPWLVAMPLVGCPAFTWDGIYVGATASRSARDSSLWAVAAFFAVWFAGMAILGRFNLDAQAHANAAVHILFASYFAHLVARDIYQTLLYRREILVRPFRD